MLVPSPARLALVHQRMYDDEGVNAFGRFLSTSHIQRSWVSFFSFFLANSPRSAVGELLYGTFSIGLGQDMEGVYGEGESL